VRDGLIDLSEWDFDRDGSVELAIKHPNFETGYRVYINAKEKFSAGVAGKSQQTTQASRVEIILQISDYEYRLGGAWLPLVLGAMIVLFTPVMMSSQNVPTFHVVTIIARGYRLVGLFLSFKTIEQQSNQLEVTNVKLRSQEKLRRDAESESEARHERIVRSEQMESVVHMQKILDVLKS